MAHIDFINSKGEEDSFSIDDKLLKNINIIRERVQKKDYDHVFIVDGAEGAGKSVFGMQLAKAFDPSFCIDRVCFSSDEFIKNIQTASKGQCVIYDEAYTGLSSRQAMSEINRMIISTMMQMRQKNLIVIMILPTFFMLDKYAAIFRSKGLFHIYTNKGRRGYWLYYNTRKKKLLYLIGKKQMDYSKPRVKFRGHFYGKYVIDEEAYRNKKHQALQVKEKVTINEKHQKQRDLLVFNTVNEKKLSHAKAEAYFKSLGMEISRTAIGFIMKKYGKPVEDTENPTKPPN